MVGKWEAVGKIQSSNYRKRILKALQEIKTPSMLEKELNIKISHISRTIKELEEMKLVKCLTNNLKKGKIYWITKKGKEIIKKVP